MVVSDASYVPLKWNEADINRLNEYYYVRTSYLQRYIGPEDRSVIDFGAGSMHIQGFLGRGVKYHPVDIVRRSDDTILCDLNKRGFPSIKADVAILSGILEYIKKPSSFLDKVSTCAEKIILTYNRALSGSHLSKNNFKYTYEGLIGELHKRGFVLVDWNRDVPPGYPMIACFKRLTPATLMENAMCTGCEACRNVCPSHAIGISEDEYGFLRPKLDVNACTGCGICIKSCPILNPDLSNDAPNTFHILRKFDRRSKSDGTDNAIMLFAEEIIGQGGVVFGTAWDEGFSANVMEVTDVDGLDALMHPKHIKSKVSDSFKKVKGHLDQGRTVLYVGPPCQIAGLKKFIGSPLPNGLHTIDILCSHLSSERAFQRYLADNHPIGSIRQITFKGIPPKNRPGIAIEFDNDREHVKAVDEDGFLDAHLKTPFLTSGLACQICPFKGFPRQGDISIGDFKGLRTDKGRELSGRSGLVLVNNLKGSMLLSKIRSGGCNVVEHGIESLKGPSLGLCSNPSDFPRTMGPQRAMSSMPFKKALVYARGKHYDVGITGMFNRNYGNNMTYYALYQALRDEGLTTLVIDCPEDSLYRRQFKEQTFPMFIHVPYEDFEISRRYPNKRSMMALNDMCDTFVLGSDQTARPSVIMHHGNYGYLGWVRSDKRKVAYAASFSDNILEGSEYQRAEMSFYFGRFDSFSVREESGTIIAKDILDIDSRQVLDPVFLCDTKHYLRMGTYGMGRIPKVPYIGAYLRFAAEWKMDLLESMADKLHLDIINAVPDGHMPSDDPMFDRMRDAKVEEWLANVINCDFFITDSFHGVCFALILNKQFIALFKEREDDRVNSLLNMVGLGDRVVTDVNDAVLERYVVNPIDFEYANRILKRDIRKSRNWLRSALYKSKDRVLMEYDLLMGMILSEGRT